MKTSLSTSRGDLAFVETVVPASSPLVRRLGGFALAGGLLLGIDVVAHLFVDDTLAPAELFGTAHELWHVPGIIGIVTALIGMIGIHLRQAPASGALGTIGFVLLLVGITLGAAYSTIFHAVFLPALEGLQPGLFEAFTDNTTTAQLIRGITVQAVGLGLGAIVYGIATIRANVLPAIGGWLLIGAALSAAANQAHDAAQLISRALFALVFIILGSAITYHQLPNATEDPVR